MAVGGKYLFRRALALLVLAAAAVGAVLLTLAARSPQNLYQEPGDVGRIVAQARAATFQVTCDPLDGSDLISIGSGWQTEIANARYIITNAHVVSDCLDSGVISLYSQDKGPLSTELLGYRDEQVEDFVYDVAVLTGTSEGGVLYMSWEEPAPGHWVLSAGVPGLRDGAYFSIGTGVLSGISEGKTLISDIDTFKGMSGGPLINSSGAVIGTYYAATREDSKRSLFQKLERLCGVAIVCHENNEIVKIPMFPDNPIKTYNPPKGDRDVPVD